MPNWGAIAQSIARGMYGDEVQDYKAKKQQMAMELERLGLAKNQDARAAAAEGRAAEQFGFEKSNWDTKRKQFEAELAASNLSNEEKIRARRTFEATGGEQGVAERLAEDRKLKQRESTRQDEELGLRRQAGSRAERELGIREAESKVRREGAERANRISSETEQARIDKELDAGSAMLLKDLQTRYNAAIRAGLKDQAAAIEEQYNIVLSELQKKKAVRNAQREAVSRVTNK